MPKWKARQYDPELEIRLQKTGIAKPLATLLAQRKIEPEKSEVFRNASYQDLSDPYVLDGIKEAVEIFGEAVNNKESISLTGDYDCDGILSSVMIKSLCISLGTNCKVFLPSRFEHGYGLNPKTISAIKAVMDTPPDLLFVLDCGSNNEQEILELKEWGVKKIIILDHHLIDQDKISKSADILINWRLNKHHEMCTCGEVYHFIRGVRKRTVKIDPIEYLSYAAIGTIGDSSPIIGDNRIIVRHGLTQKALNHVVGFGIHSLMETSNIKSKGLTQDDVAFRIVPRINAAGRMISPDVALGLFTEKNVSHAEKIAEQLDVYNGDRKTIQKAIELAAIEMVKKDEASYKYGIVLHDPSWHTGVVGITASRIAELFKKPTLIIGKHNDDIKGSGRSLLGINIKEICDTCKHMFSNYGGHEFAVGVNVKPECLDVVNEEFNKACKRYYKDNERPESASIYDIELNAVNVSRDMARMLAGNLYPYCDRFNPEPVFLIRNVKIKNAQLKEGKSWTLLLFDGEVDGKEMNLGMKMFTDDIGVEINGQTADIYFKFPQSIEHSFFGPPSLIVEDIDVKMEG